MHPDGARPAAQDWNFFEMIGADFMPRLTDVDLCAWIAQSEPGDVLEYHRGALAIDRLPVMSRLPMAECERINRLAERAFAPPSWASSISSSAACHAT